MNGHIWVNSSESGACFSICLPEGEHTTSPTKRIKTNSNGDLPALAPDPLAYQDLRVLLVDDSCKLYMVVSLVGVVEFCGCALYDYNSHHLYLCIYIYICMSYI